MRNKHHFCSRECNSIYRSSLIGTDSPNYKNAKQTYVCQQCGIDFKSYSPNRKFCSIACKVDSERCEMVDLVCENCGVMYSIHPSAKKWHDLRGYKLDFCSNECQYKYYSGENSPQWIEDRGKLKNPNNSIRWSSDMIKWRKDVFGRDNWTCQECGGRSMKGHPIILNAHHIKPFAKFPEDRFDLDNGITLCVECHKKIHQIK